MRDPTIDEIRRVRHEMSAEHDHDPRRILQYYSELQSEFADQLVNLGAKQESPGNRGQIKDQQQSVKSSESSTVSR